MLRAWRVGQMMEHISQEKPLLLKCLASMWFFTLLLLFELKAHCTHDHHPFSSFSMFRLIASSKPSKKKKQINALWNVFSQDLSGDNISVQSRHMFSQSFSGYTDFRTDRAGEASSLHMLGFNMSLQVRHLPGTEVALQAVPQPVFILLHVCSYQII